MLVLYGSETGNARDVAEGISQRARIEHGWDACALPMDAMAEPQQLAQNALVVYVCSTTDEQHDQRAGQGEVPRGMQRAWRSLLRASLPTDLLSAQRFAVFGLGDSGYADYNTIAKKLHRRLQQLQATELVDKGLGDVQAHSGYEAALDPWLQQLFAALHSLQQTEPSLLPPVPQASASAPAASAGNFLVSVQPPSPTACPAHQDASTAGVAPRNGQHASSQAGSQQPRDLERFRDACAAAAAFRRLDASVSGYQELPSNSAPTDGQGARPADWSAPAWAPVAATRRLTAKEHWQTVQHIELDTSVSGGGLEYEPGDLATLWPFVPPERAEAFLRRLNIDPNAQITIAANDAAVPARIQALRGAHAQTTLSAPALAVAMGVLDVAGAPPRRRVFALLAAHAADATERERLAHFGSAEGRDDLALYCSRERRSLLEVLQDFPSADVPLAALFEAAPKLRPRQFSISSSPLAHPGCLHLTVAVVDFRTPYKRRARGLCSSWLASLCEGDRVPVWIERGAFRLPPPEVPLICVGPGTGVAPLRGFLHHRAALAAAGAVVAPSCLFFGCRYQAQDYLYREEWEALQRAGALEGEHGVVCAFSRDGERKVYVQDRVREGAEWLWPRLFERGGAVFVSGSANSMPTAVAAAFEGVIARGMACGAVEAARLRAQLERAGRYRVEAWS